MKSEDIQKLIERFMAGLTSIDEENRLAEYFRTNDVPDEWADYKHMFAWFDSGMPLDSRQADEQTSRQADKQTSRQADKQTSRQADEQTSRQGTSTRGTSRQADKGQADKGQADKGQAHEERADKQTRDKQTRDKQTSRQAVPHSGVSGSLGPLGSSTPSAKSPKSRKLALFIIAAAAAAALLLVMAWPEKEMPKAATPTPLQTAATSHAEATRTDSLSADTTAASQPKRKQGRPRRMRRNTYNIMPPKTYIADARQDTIIEVQMLLAEKQLDEMLQQQEDSLRKMEEQYRRMDAGIDIYTIALENYEDEDDYQ